MSLLSYCCNAPLDVDCGPDGIPDMYGANSVFCTKCFGHTNVYEPTPWKSSEATRDYYSAMDSGPTYRQVYLGVALVALSLLFILAMFIP